MWIWKGCKTRLRVVGVHKFAEQQREKGGCGERGYFPNQQQYVTTKSSRFLSVLLLVRRKYVLKRMLQHSKPFAVVTCQHCSSTCKESFELSHELSQWRLTIAPYTNYNNNTNSINNNYSQSYVLHSIRKTALFLYPTQSRRTHRKMTSFYTRYYY